MQCCARDQISHMQSHKSRNSQTVRQIYTIQQLIAYSNISVAPAITASPSMGVKDSFWKDIAMRIGVEERTESRWEDMSSLYVVEQSHGRQRSNLQLLFLRRNRSTWL